MFEISKNDILPPFWKPREDYKPKSCVFLKQTKISVLIGTGTFVISILFSKLSTIAN